MKTAVSKAKGQGNTKTERYLKELCDRSFLSFWSYPCVYNDKGPGQEICDLLVVFGDDVIIFSDKEIAFPNGNDVAQNWKRWYRKAISESAKQIFGAERWIKNFPDRVYLDPSCSVKLPVNLPPPEKLKVHRVLVAHSIAEPNRKYFGGGSGSLLFDSECIGDDLPFVIGNVDESRGFVHVLDDASLKIVMDTLDTAPDFIEYLTKKEQFITGGLSIASAGEEEFLGHYLEHTDEKQKHGFLIGVDRVDSNRVVFQVGFWEAFSTSARRITQIDANKISYFWDRLIEK